MKKLALILSVIMLIGIIASAYKAENMFCGIDIITTEQKREKTEGKLVESDTLVDDVTFEYTKLIYNSLNDEYFITVGESYSGNFTFSSNIEVYFVYDEEFKYKEIISESKQFTILILNETEYQEINLIISTLPLIEISVPQIDDITREKQFGDMIITEANNIDTGRYAQEEYDITFALRGGLSQFDDKKPFKIELINEENIQYNKQMFGMNNNSDWNLTALDTEKSMIKEAICLDLIEQVALTQSPRTMFPQSMVFTELFLNGKYWGIYEFIEHLDDKLGSFDGDNTVVFKVNLVNDPTLHDNKSLNEVFILAAESGLSDNDAMNMEVSGVEVQQNNSDISIYDMNDYMIFYTSPDLTLEELFDVVDERNFIDFIVLKYILRLYDTSPNNTLYIFRENQENDMKVYRDLFDLDGSLLRPYQLESDKHTRYLDNILSASLSDDDWLQLINLVTIRYFELRETVFSEENFVKTINKYYSQLANSGSYTRNFERWNFENVSSLLYEDLINFAKEDLVNLDDFLLKEGELINE